MPKKQTVVDRDNQASLITSRVIFLQSKQETKKDDLENQNSLKDESNASNGRNTSARVIDDFIVDAPALEGATKKGLIQRYTLIIIASLLILIVIIVPTIIFTKQSPNDTSTNAFLQKLLPLLTNTSRQELNFPESVSSLALSWLVSSSNFSAYSFDQQVQRFVMAAFFFSTEGRSWGKNQRWITNDDECVWYQSSRGNECVNGTLRLLSLQKNALKGFLPNDIGLLNSLTKLDLSSNSLTGSIPSEIGALTKLEYLYLYNNSLTGSVPSEIGSLKTLQYLDLSRNSFAGSIPSEIGAATKLQYLDLSGNYLTGSVPSEIGVLTKLENLFLNDNSLTGSVPSEIGAVKTLTYLDLIDNSLIGSIPESFCNQWLYFVRVDENVTCSCCD